MRVLPVLGETTIDGGTGTNPAPAAATSAVPFGGSGGGGGGGSSGGGGGKGSELIVGSPIALWLKKQSLLQYAIQAGR